jgi:2-polyprenyl-6-methoxyphenol hydroxylase-like FAD-dependent oxidoreductase
MFTTEARPAGRIHVVGGGPVGLFLTALLQSVADQPVRLYERREEYTRTRMVALAESLIADSIESYKADPLDRRNVDALFDDAELELRLDFRRSMAPDLRALLDDWTRGFVPVNTVESTLSALIGERSSGTVERVHETVTAEGALEMLEPGDVLVDCTGTRSLFRDRLIPGDEPFERDRNTMRVHLEYALVITFLYDQDYSCNEACKYFKNVENAGYKFIPAVHRTFYDGSVSHVTGIVNISREEFEAMPPTFGGEWLRAEFPEVAVSMDRFIDKVKAETHGEVVGELEITRIPLDVYGARNMTSRLWNASGRPEPLASAPVFLLGDAAIGSPYFQSISLGLECAFFLAGHLGNRAMSIAEIFDRYENFMNRQWLRVYMRTMMIKHNKDVLETVDDRSALLEKLHVF